MKVLGTYIRTCIAMVQMYVCRVLIIVTLTGWSIDGFMYIMATMCECIYVCTYVTRVVLYMHEFDFSTSRRCYIYSACLIYCFKNLKCFMWSYTYIHTYTPRVLTHIHTHAHNTQYRAHLFIFSHCFPKQVLVEEIISQIPLSSGNLH